MRIPFKYKFFVIYFPQYVLPQQCASTQSLICKLDMNSLNQSSFSEEKKKAEKDAAFSRKFKQIQALNFLINKTKLQDIKTKSKPNILHSNEMVAMKKADQEQRTASILMEATPATTANQPHAPARSIRLISCHHSSSEDKMFGSSLSNLTQIFYFIKRKKKCFAISKQFSVKYECTIKGWIIHISFQLVL